MTPEQRLEKIEHLLAGWVEQSKAEHAENRLLWRETGRQIQEFAREGREQMAAIRAEFAERDRAWHAEIAGRDRAMDERIQKLISAMGVFISKADR